MRHDVCPATMTAENLADWIKSNKVDVFNHIEKIPLTQDEINDLQRTSSLASSQIDKLKDTIKYVQELIKNGTPWDPNTENNRPVSVTIPPTQGLKVLEANRKFADKQLENGYREDITTIYHIPWPEYEKLVAIDITGYEWSKYSRGMSRDEVNQHGKPILSAGQQLRAGLAESGMSIESYDSETRTMNIAVGDKPKKGKKNRDFLNDDDQPI